MSFVKCFDVVEMVVDEANKLFTPLWKIDDEKYRILKQYCDVIDMISEEFDGQGYDVSVDEIKMTVKIIVECQSLMLESASHKFYALAKRALSCCFSVSDNGNVNVEFVFPSIWESC